MPDGGISFKALYVASLQMPDRCLLLVICYCISINNLLTCIRDLFTVVTDVMSIKIIFSTSLLYYSCVHNVCEYIQSTHWLVPGYCLGQISCAKRSDREDSPGTHVMVIAAPRR